MSPREALPARSCQHCGTEFVPKSDRALYCTRACGQRARRRPKTEPEPTAPDTLVAAFDEAVAKATHLTDRDKAAVVAARMLAAKIDAWDTLVQWALNDATETKSRPAIPANDNTSLPTFLKYLEALRLVPGVEKVKPGPASSASPAQQALTEMRKGLAIVS